MHFQSLLIGGSLMWQYASACPRHNHHREIAKRQQVGESYHVVQPEDDWAYDASYDWGSIHPDYELCQTGTQQAPIPLTLNQGLSTVRRPTFNYPTNRTGVFNNWGYGAAFTLDLDDDDFTSLPPMTFVEGHGSDAHNETVYLSGWHTHAPADHTINGDRSRGELHYVHVDAEGHERVVVAILLDPSVDPSSWMSSLPNPLPSWNETGVMTPTALNLNLPIQEIGDLSEFWTYKGSLTSPPCHEGIRWYVGRQRLYTSRDQMRELLRVSQYGARQEQQVWEHEINL